MPPYALDAIRNGLALLPDRMNSPQAWVMLLAIGMQESRFTARRQHNNGPATGFWQFERGGGVLGVLRHPASKAMMEDLCKRREVAPDAFAVWERLQLDDGLAAAVARLLLFTDAAPLPAVSDSAGAWDYYIRNWRPGKPHRHTWDAFHAAAIKVVP